MELHTASEGITFAKQLETDSASFYEELAQHYTGDIETFLSFARDNTKNIAQIERAYYGVITDAIEGGYAFNIDPDDYTLNITIQDIVLLNMLELVTMKTSQKPSKQYI